MTGNEPHTKILWIKEEYLELILAGRKTIEVRVAYPNLTHLRAGDFLQINKQHAFRIVRITAYRDFESLLDAEDPAQIAPDLEPAQLLPALRRLYPPEKEALGALAIEIAPIRPPVD